MIIALGADRAGFSMKEKIKEHLIEKGIEIRDCGTYNLESSNYPEFAFKVANMVRGGECEFGILICGTGVGMSIAANKVHGIRAASVNEHYSTRYTRLHNDSNVLCLGARVIGEGIAIELVDVFITTSAEKGRHADRVKMITDIEEGNFRTD